MTKKWFVLLILAGLTGGCGRGGHWVPDAVGPYLGQTIPGDVPVLFAPGIVNTPLHTRDVAMTPECDEIYFCAIVGNFTYSTILVTRRIGERWTQPEVVSFASNPEYSFIEPHISPDGQRFFFASNMPNERGEADRMDIWVMERIGDGWSDPVNLDAPVNTEAGEFFPSTTRDGTLYFTRGNFIFRSRWVEGAYAEPEKLGPQVNSGRAQYNAFVDPDERYLIVPIFGRQDGFGGTDYYIVFRGEDDSWSDPVNLGEAVNTAGGREWSPYVTPDGAYFFFMRTREPAADTEADPKTYAEMMSAHHEMENGNPGIYWMSASFIETLRPSLKETAR